MLHIRGIDGRDSKDVDEMSVVVALLIVAMYASLLFSGE